MNSENLINLRFDDLRFAIYLRFDDLLFTIYVLFSNLVISIRMVSSPLGGDKRGVNSLPFGGVRRGLSGCWLPSFSKTRRRHRVRLV